MNTTEKPFDWNTGDTLDNLFDGTQPKKQMPARPIDYTPPTRVVNIQTGKRQTYIDKCDKCRGSGIFYGYNGRALGNCFKCKGKGTLEYKSSPSERQTKRDQAEARRIAKVQAQQVAFDAWADANPKEMAWLRAKDGSFDFATSLFDSLRKYGSLTEGQMAAVRKCIGRDDERKATAQSRVDNAKSVDMSKIEAAFATARSNAKELGALGIRWLKLRLDTFTFLDAPAKGEWSAAVLVREGETKLGRITGGRFVRSFACDDPTEARVLAVASDPQAAAIAYGQKFGSCAICGRELTNDGSIERGIGPICAAKYGW